MWEELLQHGKSEGPWHVTDRLLDIHMWAQYVPHKANSQPGKVEAGHQDWESVRR